MFEELLRANHDCISGHNGSKEYNEDFKSDGVLNLKKLSNPSYAHAVCLSASIQGDFDMNSDLLVANSWKGTANNVYRLEHIQELIDNNVLFPTIYFFFSEKDNIILTGKDFIANSKIGLAKRLNNQYVMLAQSSGAIYDLRNDKLISVDKFFRTKEDREMLIKTYEPLGLLTGLSDEDFISLIK